MAFEFFANISENDGDTAAIKLAIRELKETEVLIGIPEENANRKDNSIITNVELLYIHSNGSPLNNIPARPVIEPAISDASERIGPIMGAAADAALGGDMAGMRTQLEKAGMAGQRAAQMFLRDSGNGLAPLSKSTLAARARKARKASKTEKTVRFKTKEGETVSFSAYEGVALESTPLPLYDTGQILKSITYVVRKKK